MANYARVPTEEIALENGGEDGLDTFPPSKGWDETDASTPSPRVVFAWAISTSLIVGLSVAVGVCFATRPSLSASMTSATGTMSDRPGELTDFTRPPPLSRLGYEADDAYDLISTDAYRDVLVDFLQTSAPPSMRENLSQALDTLPAAVSLLPMNLFQTDKSPPPDDSWSSWPELNPTIERHFYNDDEALDEVRSIFGGSEIYQIYEELDLPVLKADFLRYLLLLAKGGVYSDVDTRCLKPIPAWANGAGPPKGDVFSGNFSEQSGVNVIIGIEADVSDDGFDSMGKFWNDAIARPLQIVQWTLCSSPGHPIFLDAVRRIVERTRKIQEWKRARDHELQYLEESEAAHRLRAMEPWQSIHPRFDRAICDWTGPGVFTDSVLSYLRRVAGTTWPDLHNLREPRQIADVIIGPVMAFRPEYEDVDKPNAWVQHYFHNTWQSDDHIGRRHRPASRSRRHPAEKCTLTTRV